MRCGPTWGASYRVCFTHRRMAQYVDTLQGPNCFTACPATHPPTPLFPAHVAPTPLPLPVHLPYVRSLASVAHDLPLMA